MKKIIEALTFDDVLLVPQVSSVVPTETDVKSRVTKKIWLQTPIISSAMDTVTESRMAIKLAELGALGVIHKNLSVQLQAEEVKKVKENKLLAAAAIGATGDFLDRAKALVGAG